MWIILAWLKRGMYRRADEEGKVRVFDLAGGYVLPGLWNVHTHLGDVFPDPKHNKEAK